MSLEPLDALSRLAERRFGSFADAATAVLDLLASAVPGGCVLLGQVDWEASEFRCSTPAARRSPAACSCRWPAADSSQLIDPDALAHVRPVPWASAALDAADGGVVGVLLAAAYGDSPSPEQLSRLLVIAARLLSYEWESVSTQGRLRRLADERSRPPQRGPGDGSLADALVEASERGGS